jgi:hypothetical protein
MASVTTGITIAAGTTIRFYRDFISGHWNYFVLINGVQKIAQADTSDLITVSSSTRRMGIGQGRGGFNNSGFITDWSGKDL